MNKVWVAMPIVMCGKLCVISCVVVFDLSAKSVGVLGIMVLLWNKLCGKKFKSAYLKLVATHNLVQWKVRAWDFSCLFTYPSIAWWWGMTKDTRWTKRWEIHFFETMLNWRQTFENWKKNWDKNGSVPYWKICYPSKKVLTSVLNKLKQKLLQWSNFKSLHSFE